MSKGRDLGCITSSTFFNSGNNGFAFDLVMILMVGTTNKVPGNEGSARLNNASLILVSSFKFSFTLFCPGKVIIVFLSSVNSLVLKGEWKVPQLPGISICLLKL